MNRSSIWFVLDEPGAVFKEDCWGWDSSRYCWWGSTPPLLVTCFLTNQRVILPKSSPVSFLKWPYLWWNSISWRNDNIKKKHRTLGHWKSSKWMEKLFFSSLPLTYRWILATLMWSRRGKKSNVCRGCRSAYISRWLISMYFFIVEALVTSAGRSKDLKARKWFLWSGLKRCLWNTVEKLLLLFPWIKGGAESFNRKKHQMPKHFLWCSYSFL